MMSGSVMKKGALSFTSKMWTVTSAEVLRVGG